MNPVPERIVLENGFCTIRIWFSKTGRARFISHLDLNRTMIRALRRAEIPLWYTEGFNRHPYVTFAAPLSLGYEGERECMDIRLIEELAPNVLVQRLDAVMPEGLSILEAAPAVMKPGALTAAQYHMFFGCSPEMLEAFLRQESIPVEKRTKKKGVTKTVELKPYLTGVLPTAAENGCKLLLTLPCSSEESVNPGLIAEALSRFAEQPVSLRVRRLALYGRDGQLFA